MSWQTTYSKNEKGQIISRSGLHYSVPNLDLLTFLFDSLHVPYPDSTPLHISAANPEHCITKGSGRTWTKRIAAALRKDYSIGAQGPDSDVVSIIAAGHHFVPFVFYGAIAAGGVYSAASSASTPEELARQLKLGRSKVLVCTPETKDVAEKGAALVGLGKEKVLVLSGGNEASLTRVIDGRNIIGKEELDWERITDSIRLENSLTCLIYSSGTTGLPKGVKISHTNFVSEAYIPLTPLKARFAEMYPDVQYRTLGHLPTAHIAGIQGYFVNPFFQGGPVYWMPKFDFQQFLHYNKKYQITSWFSVPPIFLLIAKSVVGDALDSVVYAISGAAPMGADLQTSAQKKLGKGKAFLTQTWGLSETTGTITLLPFGMTDTTGSVSGLVANVVARMVDEDGRDVEPGQPGEIIVKGPIVTKGYHDNDKANEESFVEGWFCTGDIGVWKKETGYFYIVDRKKELIKYKGMQVAPAELEGLLISHPDILDAAVIGVEGEGTEVPRAYVVVNDRTKMGEKEIKDFVKSNASSHKQLRGGVVFLDAIPKSPSGKILRKDLREMVKREKRGEGAKL